MVESSHHHSLQSMPMKYVLLCSAPSLIGLHYSTLPTDQKMRWSLYFVTLMCSFLLLFNNWDDKFWCLFFHRFLRSLKCPQYINRAMAVYRTIVDAGLEPTIVTYTILISRYLLFPPFPYPMRTHPPEPPPSLIYLQGRKVGENEGILRSHTP